MSFMSTMGNKSDFWERTTFKIFSLILVDQCDLWTFERNSWIYFCYNAWIIFCAGVCDSDIRETFFKTILLTKLGYFFWRAQFKTEVYHILLICLKNKTWNCSQIQYVIPKTIPWQWNAYNIAFVKYIWDLNSDIKNRVRLNYSFRISLG